MVHHPDDARIRHRQIDALLADGWQVTYAAPWRGHGARRPSDVPGLSTVDVVRAMGRHRLAALRWARHVLGRLGHKHDVILIHDPELLLATVGVRGLPPVVWDVHEDTAAALQVRSWMPQLVRGTAATLVRRLEAWAENNFDLILADAHYAERFRREHPVIPNTTRVPSSPPRAGSIPADVHRVVYLGSITHERGVEELVEVARRVRAKVGAKIRFEVIGPAHGTAGEVLARAQRDGVISWTGFVPNDEAVRHLDGALAGLSLLHNTANFRPSMPTKVVEYLAHGVPVITTPLPVAAELVRRSGGGAVVPFNDVEEVVAQVIAWHRDPKTAVAAGRSGHRMIETDYNWDRQAKTFIAVLKQSAELGNR